MVYYKLLDEDYDEEFIWKWQGEFSKLLTQKGATVTIKYYTKEEDGYLYEVSKNTKTGLTCNSCKGKILFKSDCVFDVVEVCGEKGHLIETKEGQFYKPIKKQNDSFVVKYDVCVRFSNIKALYMKDYYGNYLKYWDISLEENENDKN